MGVGFSVDCDINGISVGRAVIGSEIVVLVTVELTLGYEVNIDRSIVGMNVGEEDGWLLDIFPKSIDGKFVDGIMDGE